LDFFVCEKKVQKMLGIYLVLCVLHNLLSSFSVCMQVVCLVLYWLTKRKNYGFVSKWYYLRWYETFWEKPKVKSWELCSKWIILYHCGDSLFLIWYQSYALNLAMSIEPSTLKCRIKSVFCLRAPENSRALIKERLLESSRERDLKRGSIEFFVRKEDCWKLSHID